MIRHHMAQTCGSAMYQLATIWGQESRQLPMAAHTAQRKLIAAENTCTYFCKELARMDRRADADELCRQLLSAYLHPVCMQTYENL